MRILFFFCIPLGSDSIPILDGKNPSNLIQQPSKPSIVKLRLSPLSLTSHYCKISIFHIILPWLLLQNPSISNSQKSLPRLTPSSSQRTGPQPQGRQISTRNGGETWIIWPKSCWKMLLIFDLDSWNSDSIPAENEWIWDRQGAPGIPKNWGLNLGPVPLDVHYILKLYIYICICIICWFLKQIRLVLNMYLLFKSLCLRRKPVYVSMAFVYHHVFEAHRTSSSFKF